MDTDGAGTAALTLQDAVSATQPAHGFAATGAELARRQPDSTHREFIAAPL